MRIIWKSLLVCLCVAVAGGCAPQKKIAAVPRPATVMIPPSVPGTYHLVKKGETLWRISRTYNINLDDLARFNRITDTCSIEINQKIFIPDSLRTVPRNEQPALGATTDFIWPYKGPLASCYNQLNQNVRNQGIDIIARVGSSVNAAAGGNVIFTSENMRGYGKTIIIQHPGNFITTYTNSQENLVKTGDYVKQGQTIAKAGSSGRTSRCIVHFELRKNNRPQNPLLYLP